MGASVYPIAIGISIVILSFAVAVVAIIKAKAKHSQPSFMAGLKDLKETQDDRYALAMSKREMNHEGLIGRSIPISKEEFKACREDIVKPSYQEVMLAEQLLNRITMAKIACSESERLFLEVTNVPTKVTKAIQYKSEIASDRHIYDTKCYLHAVASAAHWHLEGLISFEVYKHLFLKNAVAAYDEIYTAQFYSDIEEVVERYGHLVENRNREEDCEEDEDEIESATEKEDK